MKIGIIGTRGIPNHYGGFEQFAEIVSNIWANHGHEVSVYCSHNHPFGKGDLGPVKRILVFDPEYTLGTTGQFVYDVLCILDSRKRGFDVLLQLGYTSSAIWHWLIPEKPVLVTNMDGLEWKRTKFSPLVRKVIHWFEKLAVKHGGWLVADSIGIQSHLLESYGKISTFITYGAVPVSENLASTSLDKMELEPFSYNLVIARLEPENHVETILKGIRESGSKRKTLIVGSLSTPSGKQWKAEFIEPYFHFLGSIYDKERLDEMRQNAYIYYHGHSVGGTNPSLLEAMAAGSLICANDNVFNKSVLGEDGFYFENEVDVARFQTDFKFEKRKELSQRLRTKIREIYSWEKIAMEYVNCFHDAARSGGKRI